MRYTIHQDQSLSKQENIYYQYFSWRGLIILCGVTRQGICYLGLAQDRNSLISDCQQRFPGVTFWAQRQAHHKLVEDYLLSRPQNTIFPFHLIGSDFQRQVWQALLTIPSGQLRSYSEVAGAMGKSKAVRAIASAIGQNPVSILIPCHRVIQKNGSLGHYYWGSETKQDILAWEQSV